ncbi:hypothetical protein FXO37_02819 [Capsicum annuum]|nr:hypothetical protein FXO37_02819 [Capsicum annuum]
MGRRARIPSEKARLAQQTSKQQGKQIRREPEEDLDSNVVWNTEGNRECSTKLPEKIGTPEQNTWEEAIKETPKSWADEVEEATDLTNRESVWDNFDLSKLAKAWFKLEFVAPAKQGDSKFCEIEVEDINTEIEFWKHAIVCYVLGAHPPFSVMNGYIQRQWGKHGINKVSMLKNGIVLVRFDSSKGKEEVLQGGIYHFDNKPLIVKAWHPYMEFTREELYTVPIWVKLPGLDFKYWSPKGLSKIGSLIGKPLMVDHNAENKHGLSFARLLIEVEMRRKLPDKVLFRNERGELVEQKVLYDWKPTLCNYCKQYVHDEDICRKKNPQLNPKDKEPRKGNIPQKGVTQKQRTRQPVGEDLKRSKEIMVSKTNDNSNIDGTGPSGTAGITMLENKPSGTVGITRLENRGEAWSIPGKLLTLNRQKQQVMSNETEVAQNPFQVLEVIDNAVQLTIDRNRGGPVPPKLHE